MTHPAALQVEHALEELVNQFSDPLSFLRELVQNSLDAGSDEVEITVAYEPPKEGSDATGLAIVHVDDFGEGMTRQIIEKRLTRLFSSAKDGDKTKIGKFGIGFVSVFAIQPEAVCIDTSREGEHWRVLFDAQRRFKLIRRPDPVDGTKITVYKSMEAGDFEDFVSRARRVVEYWCKHTRGEIRFDGEVVNRELQLEAACQVVHDDGFSRVVVGHRADHRPFFGFYNTGLTLTEGGDEYFDAIAFKASSPHLEHTLTRDAVIHDEGYHRVVGAIHGAVDAQLCVRVFELLEKAVRDAGHEDLDYLYRAATWHAARTQTNWTGIEERAIFSSPSGGGLTVKQAKGEHDNEEILVSAFDSPLTRALQHRGDTVVLGSEDRPVGGLLRRLARRGVSIRTAEKWYAMPLPPDDELELQRYRPVTEAAQRLWSSCGLKLREVAVAHFDYGGSPIASEVAITQATLGELSLLAQVRTVGVGFFSSRRTLVLNADHPAIGELVALSTSQPYFAAYLLSKLFLVGDSLDAELDGRLAAAALEQERA